MQSKPKLLTAKEAAGMIGISVSTLRRWTDRGIGPKPRMFGTRSRWTEADIDEWIKEAKQS